MLRSPRSRCRIAIDNAELTRRQTSTANAFLTQGPPAHDGHHETAQRKTKPLQNHKVERKDLKSPVAREGANDGEIRLFAGGRPTYILGE
jgi:hypothetical protein